MNWFQKKKKKKILEETYSSLDKRLIFTWDDIWKEENRNAEDFKRLKNEFNELEKKSNIPILDLARMAIKKDESSELS